MDRLLDIILNENLPDRLRQLINNLIGLLQIPIYILLLYYIILSIEHLFDWNSNFINLLSVNNNTFLEILTNPTMLYNNVNEILKIFFIMLIFLGCLSAFNSLLFASILFSLIYTIFQTLIFLQIGLKLYLIFPESYALVCLGLLIFVPIVSDYIDKKNILENHNALVIKKILIFILYIIVIFV